MNIEGIMTLNGKEYKNSLTSWGHSLLFDAMFNDIPFPIDWYLILAGVSRDGSSYPGQPYPYGLDELIPDSLATYIRVGESDAGNPIIPFNLTDWDNEGNPITPGFEFVTPQTGNAVFEFGQSTVTRVKVSPFHVEGKKAWTDTIPIDFPELSQTYEYPGEKFFFFLTTSPTLFDNTSKIFNKILLGDWSAGWTPTRPPLPYFSFSEGARFSYSFTIF